MKSSKINREYLDPKELESAINEIKRSYPKRFFGGLRTKKCSKCGGTIHPIGTGIIQEKCSRCGETHSDVRLK